MKHHAKKKKTKRKIIQPLKACWKVLHWTLYFSKLCFFLLPAWKLSSAKTQCYTDWSPAKCVAGNTLAGKPVQKNTWVQTGTACLKWYFICIMSPEWKAAEVTRLRCTAEGRNDAPGCGCFILLGPYTAVSFSCCVFILRCNTVFALLLHSQEVMSLGLNLGPFCV